MKQISIKSRIHYYFLEKERLMYLKKTRVLFYIYDYRISSEKECVEFYFQFYLWNCIWYINFTNQINFPPTNHPHVDECEKLLVNVSEFREVWKEKFLEMIDWCLAFHFIVLYYVSFFFCVIVSLFRCIWMYIYKESVYLGWSWKCML